ncbi:MAG: hypothetical protein M3041_19710 [Acidobacteriota bacterium]|nr:hypothetical protein [Acidobacteriota bacterium]
MRNPLAILLLAAAAQLPRPYTRVLLPLYLEQSVPGAFGSLWVSRFAVHNGGQISYLIDTCSPVSPDIFDPGCLAFLDADEEVRSNETQAALPRRYPKPENGAAGAVMYLHPRAADTPDPNSLSFELRITDVSRSSTSAGTEVPVVRESGFRTATLRLLDVPTDARFRSVVRLFEMNLARAEFTVRIIDPATNTLLSERRVTTSTPPQGPLRFHPGFVQIADPTASLGTAQPANVRVEIEPLTAGSAFWAYVSITNNDSQQVTLVTPQ